MSTTIPRARVTDPATSHAAAASVSDLSSTQDRIYNIIGRLNGASDELIYHTYRADHGYISPSGARTRRKELCDVSLVVDSGDRWLTESGRESIIWRIA